MSKLEEIGVSVYTSTDDFPNFGNQIGIADGVLQARTTDGRKSTGVSLVNYLSEIPANANGVYRLPSGELLSYVNGVSVSGNKVNNFSIMETFETMSSKVFATSSANVTPDTTNFFVERGYRLALTYTTGTVNEYIEVQNTGGGNTGGYLYDASLPITIAYYVNAGTTASLQIGVMLSNTGFGAAPTPDNIIAVGVQQLGFNTLTIPSRSVHTWGATDDTGQNYKKLRFYLRVTGGTAGDVHDITIMGIFQGKPKPKVVISFDDALQSVYTMAYPVMKSLGLKGSVAVIGSVIGSSYETYPGMTLAQLKELYDNGWELTVHGATQHATLGTESAIYADIAANKKFLTDNGLVGSENIYVYPGGSIVTAGNASYNALSANGMIAARHTSGGNFSFIGEGIKDIYKTDRYRLAGHKMAQDNFTPTETAFKTFQDCVESGLNKYIYCHGVKSGATVDAGRESTDISTQYLYQFLNRFAVYKRMGLVTDCSAKELLANAPTISAIN